MRAALAMLGQAETGGADAVSPCSATCWSWARRAGGTPDQLVAAEETASIWTSLCPTDVKLCGTPFHPSRRPGYAHTSAALEFRRARRDPLSRRAHGQGLFARRWGRSSRRWKSRNPPAGGASAGLIATGSSRCSSSRPSSRARPNLSTPPPTSPSRPAAHRHAMVLASCSWPLYYRHAAGCASRASRSATTACNRILVTQARTLDDGRPDDLSATSGLDACCGPAARTLTSWYVLGVTMKLRLFRHDDS